MEDDLLIEITPEINDANQPSIIKVIGVGGGGGNAVGNMYKEQIEGVRFVVCNTDMKALQDSPVPDRVQIGEGLGAGGRPEIGQRLAEENITSVQGMLDDATKMVFITAGMGGGTGTGAAPIVAREAMKRGILTIGIVTIPFLFEMKPKIDKALDGVEKMAQEVDALLVVNNERLRHVYSDLTVVNAFKKADDTLTKAVRSIVEIITMRGFQNLDFCDVETCLRGGGVAVMSTGYASGDKRVTKAIADALNSPLLNDKDIYKSKSLRLAIFYPPESTGNSMMMDEMNEINEFMMQFREDVDVKYGMTEDAELTDEIKITILASGFRLAPGQDPEEDMDVTPRTAEQIDEEKQKERRRQEAYEGTQMRQRYHRIFLFEDEDFDNEELIAMVEGNDVYRRTDSDSRKLREVSQANKTIEMLED
ncbi:MAG: cell division protein FtsZ [Bacteroidales bacterium]|nr:cell division protein FtsZ [Bacteroidales bacterium]